MTTAMQMGRGLVFRTPAGSVAVALGMKDEDTVTAASGQEYPVADCAPVKDAEDIPAHVSCGEEDKIGHVGMIPGFTVSCLCVKMWGRKAQIWTPCCGQVKRGLEHTDAVKCSKCGWWWRLFLGATHKIVWLGSKRPYDVPANK